MRDSGGYRVHEWPSLLQEVVELSVFVAGSTLLTGDSSRLSGDSHQNVSDLLEGKFFTRR